MSELSPEFNAWAALARGKTLGKRSLLRYLTTTSVGNPTNTPTDILNISADDDNALQLQILLSPPRTANNALVGAPTDIQQLQGTMDNIEFARVSAGVGQIAYSNPGVEIEWGIGGVSNKVQCDILNGLCLNLSASYVRMKGFVDQVLVSTLNTIYELSAFIGPGNAKGSFGAQRSLVIANLADAQESAAFPVPRFAKNAYLFGAVAAGNLFVGHLRFWRDDVGAASTLPVADLFFSGNALTPCAIPNGAMYFTALNSSGIAAQPVTALFELAI